MLHASKHSDALYEKWRSTAALMINGKTGKERLLSLFTAALFLIFALILSARDLPYTSLTLGIPCADALLCASSTYTPFVFLGSVLGSVFFEMASTERFLTLGFIFVLRLITGAKGISGSSDRELFSESVITKTAISSVMSFIECGMFIASNGITAQSAKAVLATLTVLPALTLVFSVYYAKDDSSKLHRFTYELSMTVLFACAVYCAKDLSFSFFEIDTLLCIFFSLSVAKYGGLARSCVMGFVLGYICSPSYFLCYLSLAAVASVTLSLGIFSACGIALTAACVCSILLRGHMAIYSIIPDMITSTALVWPILKYNLLCRHFPYPFNDQGSELRLSDAHRLAYAEISSCSALRSLSDGLRSLSSDIDRINKILSDTKEPAIPQRSHPKLKLFDTVRTDFCEKCSMYPICHDTESAQTKQAICDLVLLCLDGKIPSADDMPIYLCSHCIRLRELTLYTQRLCNEQGNTAQSSRFIAPVNENPEISTLISYSCAADILTAIAESFEKEMCIDPDAQKALGAAFHRIGLGFSAITVIGSQRKKVYLYGAEVSRIIKLSEMIHKELIKVFGYSFSTPRISEEDGFPTVFTPAPTLKVDAAVAISTKSNEPVSGDTVIAFNDADENFYALISDGMGSGRAAQKSSVLTATLIKNLLIGKVERTLALKITGNAVSKTCSEYFSTVDLMKLDLVSGETVMTKSYAATSYVMRNGSVYCCDASSMPIGINEDNEPFETTFVLADGDTVVMVSDGIAETADTGITDVLGLHSDLPAKQLADKILAYAIELNGKNDDMTALVLKIKKAA